MLGLLLTAAVLVSLAAIIAAVIVTTPARRARRNWELRACVSANHQELFLLVRDLLALQEHGYASIFPDPETLERARKLTHSFRQEIGP